MTLPIAFTDLTRQIATAITTEAQKAGLSQGEADDLMARVLKRLGMDEQTTTDLRRSEIQGAEPSAE